jgi:hypothetical protein
MKAIKSNLKNQIGTDDKTIMYCPCCFDEFSANKGDYFLLPDDYVFHCANCDCDMVLGHKQIIYKEA